MLTNEQIQELAKPFTKSIGSHWENELAIPEQYIEYFAHAIACAVINYLSPLREEIIP